MTLSSLSRIQRFFRSIFAKLLLIIAGTWILILVTVVSAFFFSRHADESPWSKNLHQYLHYIERDLGSPPDRENALQIYHKTGFHISYDAPHLKWTTRKQFPKVAKIRFHPLAQDDKVQIGGKFGHHILWLKTKDGNLYFENAGVRASDEKRKFRHLCLLAFLTIILLVCYLAVRHILRPLKWIATGVSEVKGGNLSYRVRLRGKDELTDLAASFNDMTNKLKVMIETKEYLLRDVSHELRSPLTRMRVALELLGDNPIKTELEQDLIEMEQMISTILETARDHHLSRNQQMADFDLDRFLQSLTENYKNRTPGVRYISPDKPTDCRGNQQSLQTVFSNLIENGLKFSRQESAPVEVELIHRKKFLQVTVSDSGIGVESSELPFIFEPFYRVDKSRSKKSGGFGLGLSLCKAIVEAHGGKIEAESEPDKGTRIVVTLTR